MRVNKWSYEWIVQGDYGYGHGWEDLTAEPNYAEAHARLKEYRENDNYGIHRLIRRRVINPAWELLNA